MNKILTPLEICEKHASDFLFEVNDTNTRQVIESTLTSNYGTQFTIKCVPFNEDTPYDLSIKFTDNAGIEQTVTYSTNSNSLHES